MTYKMITLHHLNNSRSQRIIWLLELLSVEYRIEHYQRDAKTNLAPAKLKDIHALGKSPVITDGEKVIAESGLIIEYLCETYGGDQFLMGNDENHWDVKYWLHYGEGSLMPLLVMKLIFDKIKSAPKPFMIKPIANAIVDKAMSAYAGPNIANNVAYIEQYLAKNHQHGNDYLCGPQITAADIQMIFPLEALVAKQHSITKKQPHIYAYVKRIHALPEYKKALEAGGEYDYA